MITTYVCSSCRREIGKIVGFDGKPSMFICPYSHQAATVVEKMRA